MLVVPLLAVDGLARSTPLALAFGIIVALLFAICMISMLRIGAINQRVATIRSQVTDGDRDRLGHGQFRTVMTAREVTSLGATYTAKGFVWFANTAWGKDPLNQGRIHSTEVGVTYDFTPNWMLGVDYAYVPVTTNDGRKAKLTQPAIGAKCTLSKRTFLFSSLAVNHSSDTTVLAATLDRPGGATVPFDHGVAKRLSPGHSTQLLRPTADAASQVAGGDLTLSLDPPGKDEAAMLLRSVQTMTGQLGGMVPGSRVRR